MQSIITPSRLVQQNLHRQFTVYTSSRARLERRRVRAPSYSSIPSVIHVVNAFRVPIVIIVIGAGGFWYAQYKFEQVWKQVTRWIHNVEDTAKGAIKATSDGVKSVSHQVSNIKPPQVETPPFLKDISRVVSDDARRREFEELGKKATGWLSTTATDGAKFVSHQVTNLKLPQTETPSFLKSLFPSNGAARRDDVSANQNSEDKRSDE